MRRFIVLVAMTGLLAGVVLPAASAAPSDSRIAIGSSAQFVTATTILVPVTYVCPASFVTGFVSVFVSQEESGETGGGGTAAPCTGEPETVAVTVSGGPWELGPALARGSISGAFFGDSHIRRIQIGL
jgi:hypothetical protein